MLSAVLLHEAYLQVIEGINIKQQFPLDCRLHSAVTVHHLHLLKKSKHFKRSPYLCLKPSPPTPVQGRAESWNVCKFWKRESDRLPLHTVIGWVCWDEKYREFEYLSQSLFKWDYFCLVCKNEWIILIPFDRLTKWVCLYSHLCNLQASRKAIRASVHILVSKNDAVISSASISHVLYLDIQISFVQLTFSLLSLLTTRDTWW